MGEGCLNGRHLNQSSGNIACLKNVKYYFVNIFFCFFVYYVITLKLPLSARNLLCHMAKGCLLVLFSCYIIVLRTRRCAQRVGNFHRGH